jgi:hypothetical protein
LWFCHILPYAGFFTLKKYNFIISPDAAGALPDQPDAWRHEPFPRPAGSGIFNMTGNRSPFLEDLAASFGNSCCGFFCHCPSVKCRTYPYKRFAGFAIVNEGLIISGSASDSDSGSSSFILQGRTIYRVGLSVADPDAPVSLHPSVVFSQIL